MEKTFLKYGNSFQDKLVTLILMEPSFSDQMREILDLNLLTQEHHKILLELVYEYKDTYSLYPTHDTMITLIKTQLDDQDDRIKRDITNFYTKVIKTVNVDDADYVKAESLQFCKTIKLEEAMLKAAKMLKEGSRYDEIFSIITQAGRLGADNNFGYNYKDDFEERFKFVHRNTISTGWSRFDSMTKGGLGKKELGVVIASTGSGKSMVLVHLGAQALLQAKNVVYYTLELTETSIANRFDSCLTGIPLDNLEKSKDKVFETIKDVKGSLIIKEYPTKTASVMTLKNHLERLRSSGFKPDLVLVDYADLLSTKSQSGQKWSDLEGLYEDLRATAQIFNVSIVTASQTNRSGINAEVVTLESISDAFSKCFVADLIITLSRNSKDKMENTGRLYVAKNRNGPDGLLLPLHMDTSKVYIDVLDQEPENIEDAKKAGEHKAAISLKQKFNQVKDSLQKTEINGEE